MPKRPDGEEETDTKELNAYLKEELADDDAMETIGELADSMSTTMLLSGLEYHWQNEFEDEVAASLIKAFRIRFAAHELKTR
jgi:hypothetical protein